VDRSPLVVMACVLAGGCASITPPLPNPAGLPPDALALEYVVEHGCLPYLMGEKLQDPALRVYFVPPSPIPDPFEVRDPGHWTVGFNLGLKAVLSQNFCHVSFSGTNFDAYRAATDMAFFNKFGPGIDDDGRSTYKTVLPGQIIGCRGSVRYSYAPLPRGFNVQLHPDPHPHWVRVELDLYRLKDCASDPMRFKGS
jgi:hypothetical protein